MPTCAVLHCKSYTAKCSKKHGITFYRFPKDPFKEDKWTQIIKDVRKDPTWTPHECHRICSKHFDKKTDITLSKCGYKKLKPDAVPHLRLELDPEPIPDHPPPPEKEPLPPEEEDAAELKNFLDDDSVLGFDLNVFTDMFDSPKEKKFVTQVRRLERSRQKYRDKVRLLTRTNSRLKNKNEKLTELIKQLNIRCRRYRKNIRTRDAEVNTTDDIFFLC